MAQSSSGLLDDFLGRHPDTEHISCQILSYGNVPQGRYIPITRAKAIAAGQTRLNVANSMNRIGDASGLHMPDVTLMAQVDDIWEPDWTTLRPSFHAGQADVQCYVLERSKEKGKERVCDPREVLRLAEVKANKLGLDIQVGFEIEFVFLDKDDKVERTIPLPIFNAASTRSAFRSTIFEALKFLEKDGLSMWGFHPENEGWEMATSPATPLQAVDNLTWIQDTLKEVAWKNGQCISFYPYHLNEHTAGQHLHISVKRHEDQFLAGLLEHLPAATAFLNGGYDSYTPYRRFWNGGGLAAWSYGKGGSIRRFEDNHFEIRLGDTLCSSYLQLAAAIQAGIAGIEAQLPLTIRSLSAKGFFVELPEEELKAAGITKKLPASLSDSLDVLQQDKDKGEGLSASMGNDLVDAYIKYRRAEVKDQGSSEPEVRRSAVIKHI